tara:strand:+ start:259 stop:438 length:180 start_codon:yes stop_codon:yes gene_type:complete
MNRRNLKFEQCLAISAMGFIAAEISYSTDVFVQSDAEELIRKPRILVGMKASLVIKLAI